MPDTHTQLLRTPRPDDLGLTRLSNPAGLQITLLPNGALFALEHQAEGRRIMINRCLGSAVAGSLGRLYLRVGGGAPRIVPIAGAEACCRVGATAERYVWTGEAGGVCHEVTLQLHAQENLWLWRVQLRNEREHALPCDTVLIQDLGLGEPGFVMNN